MFYLRYRKWIGDEFKIIDLRAYSVQYLCVDNISNCEGSRPVRWQEAPRTSDLSDGDVKTRYHMFTSVWGVWKIYSWRSIIFHARHISQLLVLPQDAGPKNWRWLAMTSCRRSRWCSMGCVLSALLPLTARGKSIYV